MGSRNEKSIRVLRWVSLPMAVGIVIAFLQAVRPELSIAALGALVAVATLYLLRAQQRRFDQMEGRASDRQENVIRQMDALFSLHFTLQVGFPLPPSRGWAASPDVLRVAALEIATRRPALVVELGSGISTLVHAMLLKKFRPDGRLVSIEHDSKYAEVVLERVRAAGLADWVEIVVCPLVEYPQGGESGRWYGIPIDFFDRLPPIGFLFVDGPPGNLCRLARSPALSFFSTRMAPQAAILVDDSNRDDERAMIELWMRQFPQLKQIPEDCEKGAVLLRWS